MNENLTEIVVILDRSGSMQSVRKDMEGGMNQFIEEQKKQDGEAMFTLAQFDDNYEIVHDGIDIKDVPELKLIPRGMTALLDGIGKTVNAVGERLDKTDEDKKPSTVVVVVITDGHENASKEFTKSQVNNIIKKQKDDFSWEFIFLGANQDAIAEGGSMGVSMGKSLSYDNNAASVKCMYSAVSRATSSIRGGIDTDFTAKERDTAKQSR